MFFNAPENPSTGALLVANILAQHAILLVPLLLVGGWLRGTRLIRIGMLQAACAGVLGLLITQLIGLAWPTPRPFMSGLGHQFLAHAAEASFPSDHLTLWWSVAMRLMLHARTRVAGAWLTIVGIPVAWARIYLGVHFSLDMAGAIAVAATSAAICQRGRLWLAGMVSSSGCGCAEGVAVDVARTRCHWLVSSVDLTQRLSAIHFWGQQHASTMTGLSIALDTGIHSHLHRDCSP